MFRDYFPDCIGATIGAGLSLALYMGLKSDKKLINSLLDAPELSIDANLVSTVSKIPTGITGCLIGVVKAQDKPIQSFVRPDVTGVIWKHTIKEHVMANVFGLWRTDARTLNIASQDVPFVLEDNGLSVQVSSPSKLESIDLSIVSQKFVAASNSLADCLWGWMKGIQPTGTQEIEEMLLEGTRVLGVGRLVVQNGRLFLQPCDELPFVITTMDKGTLLESLRSQHNVVQLITIVSLCGTSYFFYRLGRRIITEYLDYARRRDEKRALDLARLKRKHHGDDLPENLMCVVCCGLRDVVLMPCQHVCVCGECSLKLNPRKCPVCRSAIDNIQPVFYS